MKYANNDPRKNFSLFLNDKNSLQYRVLSKEIQRTKKQGKVLLNKKRKVTAAAIFKGVLNLLYEDPDLCEELFGVKNFNQLVDKEEIKELSI